MDISGFIRFMSIAEKLKCNTRHSWTSTGRHESVAEHSWRTALMALLCRDEYPETDINRVIAMCLIHDLGEAVTGDIPSFDKTAEDERREDKAVNEVLSELPEPYRKEFEELFDEMTALKTPEAKLFKALDNMEAVISHNEASVSTWIPLEYTENLVYGEKNAAFSDWTATLRKELRKASEEKLRKENKDADNG